MTDFERVKEHLDLVTTIETESELKMRRSHLEECPFCRGHECFSIDRDKRVYKCFQCDAGGDVFTFLESFYNIDKAEALRRAEAAAGITLAEPKRREIRLTTKERIFLEAANYYHGCYNENGAKSYLVETRKHREEVLKAMRVGWTDGGLVEHLQHKGFTDVDIKVSGLARERIENGAIHLSDYFVKGLAIFPHFEGNKVLHFTIKDPAKKYLYQLRNEARSREWRFYSQAALHRFNEIVVVEGENDLLSVMDAGVQHVVGLIGQPSEEQTRSLKTSCVGKHLYLWMDNDEDPEKPLAKGKGYIRKLCTELREAKYNVRVIVYSHEYKDPDEYLLAFQGDRRKEIKRLQREALDYITWEIGEVSRLEGLDKRLTALKDRKIFTALGDMVEAEKLVDLEQAGRQVDLPGKNLHPLAERRRL
jgi:DNA primase